MNLNFLKNIESNIFPSLLSEVTSNEDIGFRPLGEDRNTKGLNPLTRDKQLRAVYAMWLKNGFANRILEIAIDFIIGSDFIPDNVTSQERKEFLKKLRLMQLKKS